jgi:hypothetical protein
MVVRTVDAREELDLGGMMGGCGVRGRLKASDGGGCMRFLWSRFAGNGVSVAIALVSRGARHCCSIVSKERGTVIGGLEPSEGPLS